MLRCKPCWRNTVRVDMDSPAMRYQHYKGGLYELVCEARLEADPSVILMIYKSANGLVWARPKDVFFERVQHQGQTVPRFAPLGE